MIPPPSNMNLIRPVQSRKGSSRLRGQRSEEAQSLSPLSLDRGPVTGLTREVDWEFLTARSHEARLCWHPDALPICVSPLSEDLSLDLVKSCCHSWESASQGRVRFEFSLLPGSLTFQWVDNPLPGRPYEVGHTDRHLQGPWIVGATITLVRNTAIDPTLTPSQQSQRLQATVLHELGHALGLEHNQVKRAVMHAQGYLNTSLHPQDIAAIQQHYPVLPMAVRYF